MPRGGAPGEEVYQQEVQPEDLPRKIVPRMEVVPVGPAFGEAGQAIEQKYRADSATWAGDQLAQFRTQAVSDLETAKQNAPAGDPGEFTPKYLAAYDKNAQALSSIPYAETNPYARAMIQRGVGQLRDTLAQHSLEWEATQRKASQLDSIQQNLDTQLPLVRSHPELADQVGSTLNDQIQSSIIDPDQKMKLLRAMDTKLTREAALGKVDQNPGGVYQQLQLDKPTDPILSRLTDPQTRQEVTDKATEGLVHQLAGSAVQAYQVSPQAGQAAFSAVDNLTLDKNETKNEYLKQLVRDSINRQRGELIQQNQQIHAQDVIQLEASLKDGQPDPARRGQIWAGYRNGWLTPEQTGSMLGEDSRLNRKQAEDGAGLQTIQDAWDGKVLLDPKNPTMKTDANNWFLAQAKQNGWQQGSPQWVNFAAEFAHRSGIVPEPVGEWSRSVLVGSQDPQQIMRAADTVARMRNAAPRAFEYLDDDHRLGAMADSITNLTGAGMDPANAVRIARENYTQGESNKKLMDEKWNAARPFGPRDDAIDGVLKNQISADPRLTVPGRFWGRNSVDRPPAMQADYHTLVRQYFDHNGGDPVAAERSAARDIGTVWGITQMNGAPEIVRYAPERMFRAPDGGPGLSAEDIRTDVASTVLNHPENFQHWDDEKRSLVPMKVDPDRVKLVPSEKTPLTRGVTWGALYQNEDGTQESLYDKNGRPLQFDLPVTRMNYEAMRSQALKDRIAKAKQLFDEQQSSEAQAMEALNRDQAQHRGGAGRLEAR
jgi:hypothetical protein